MDWEIGDLLRLLGKLFNAVGQEDIEYTLANGEGRYRSAESLMLVRIPRGESMVSLNDTAF